MEQKPDMVYFAETDFRGKRNTFGIKNEDRSRHVYVIGKTGMGKSTLLENLVIQDIKNGEGVAFLDPHGKSADLLLDYIPEDRIKDVVYFAPFDLENPIAFNVMEDVGKDQRHLVANGLMATFKKIWPDVWSGRMEYILANTILALLEYPEATLLGVNRMLSDKAFRKKVVDNIQDPTVKAFWTEEFAKYSERYMQEAGDAIKNKIGQFTANPLIRNIIGQPKSSFDMRKVMDEKKILIVNLSKGRLGEINAQLIGGLLVTKIYLAAMSRAGLHENEVRNLPPFYMFVDEFQSFVNEAFSDILSEARKYKLSLTIAHQYIEQMPEEVRSAVFGNMGTIITFRVGPFDAEVLEKIFDPTFVMQDLVNLGFAQIYLTLMVDGVGSSPFSAVTLPPIPALDSSMREKIIDVSRGNYARKREIVEKEIFQWYGNVEAIKDSSGQKINDFKNNKQDSSRPQSKPKTNYNNTSRPEVRSKPKTNYNNSQRPEAKAPSRTFSLSSLKSEDKGSGKNNNALKEALADVMGGTGVGKKNEEKKIEKNQTPKEKKRENSNPDKSEQASKKEVPEDVLRKMLEL